MVDLGKDLCYNTGVERYLCLDIGDKRIGVAVSDPFNSYSLPVKTYNRKNLREDLKRLASNQLLSLMLRKRQVMQSKPALFFY